MFLNASIPHIYCYIRKQYLYDCKKHFDKYQKCAIFGITSVQSFAITFSIMLDNGAQIDRMPISAFCTKPCKQQALEHLQLWDCFSYDIAVTEYDYLKLAKCRTILKDGKWYFGEYLFTVDWAKSSYAEDAGEGGHKSAHIIKLDNGNFAAQPNNRIQWFEASFITKPFKNRPDYKTNNSVWKAENKSAWHASNNDKQFYDTIKLK